MEYTFEGLKQGMRELAALQNRLFWDAPLKGERHVLPLEGRDIAVVFYQGQPTDPVLFCCYGGGFIMGSAANDDSCWAQLRDKLSVNLFSINYRKAPEHPFPEPLYDVYDSITYLETHLSDFGIQSQDFSVFGFSAGGNLAAAVCLLDAKRGAHLNLKRQILCYPYLDLVTSPRSKGHAESERMIYSLFPEWYCADHDPQEALISPVYAVEESLRQLPRVLMCIAESDPLHAEDARYAAKLRAAGVEVACQIAMDMPHGYIETAFQEPGPYLSEKATAQLLSGIIGREKDRSFDFIKKNF